MAKKTSVTTDRTRVTRGWELLGQYVEPGYCEPITKLYKSDGWDKTFPKELLANLMTKDRQIYEQEKAKIRRRKNRWSSGHRISWVDSTNRLLQPKPESQRVDSAIPLASGTQTSGY